MDKAKRIAFIRPKAWPLANQIVAGVLREQFPDHEVDVVEISTLVRRRPDLVLVNSIATILLYGKDIAQGRKKFRLAFWRTPFIFRQVRRLVRRRITHGGYAFTFQMQSLFDASTPGILYTPTTPTWKTVIIRQPLPQTCTPSDGSSWKGRSIKTQPLPLYEARTSAAR